jgi:uracil-DNA glycosylase
MISSSIESIKTDWKPLLETSIHKFPNIETLLSEEQENFEGLAEIYPKPENIFSCFNYFNKNDLKIIILGQDPYHQPNQAHGLSFSVSEEMKVPPSLKNIFKEIISDIPAYNSKDIPKSGNLEYLGKQGVLLLNNTFTVRQSSPNSHLKIWKGFCDYIINDIMTNQTDIIFMLWGGNAKKIMDKLPEELLEKHHILKANHPSPLSANRSGWFGCKHFSKSNELLNEMGKKEIKWLK